MIEPVECLLRLAQTEFDARQAQAGERLQRVDTGMLVGPVERIARAGEIGRASCRERV